MIGLSRSHCCERMAEMIDRVCDQHPDIFECPDSLVCYAARFDEYSLIIHDGGTATVSIDFCPWCGARLPGSKRELWFDMLNSLGYDDPLNQEVPNEFQTDAWYTRTN